MSWLKSLNYKRFLKLPSRNISQGKIRFLWVLPWNQSTKVLTGLLASVFSMMALISFFGSLEQPASINSTLSEEGGLGFELGASDELSLEFGLDATLPTREPELAKDLVTNPRRPKSVIRTVSVQQAAETGQENSNVHHAVGFEFGNQKSGGRIEQLADERPVYINGLRPASRSAGAGAVWLTGEIEETNDLPVNGSARRVRN